MVCASCGHANSEGAKFCEECGFSFAAAPTGAKEQRKTVTVLFCDLTGSTALGETLDPERLRALLARYFERMKAIVERHGGSVEKFIGDSVMAVFGVPVLATSPSTSSSWPAITPPPPSSDMKGAGCSTSWASRASSRPRPGSWVRRSTRSTGSRKQTPGP